MPAIKTSHAPRLRRKKRPREDAELLAALVRAERAEAALSEIRAAIEKETDSGDKQAQHKIEMLRLIFLGIALLMSYLGLLVAINWWTPTSTDKDGVGIAFFQTSKDILLVLTGILGSAMANVFDPRSSKRSGGTNSGQATQNNTKRSDE